MSEPGGFGQPAGQLGGMPGMMSPIGMAPIGSMPPMGMNPMMAQPQMMAMGMNPMMTMGMPMNGMAPMGGMAPTINGMPQMNPMMGMNPMMPMMMMGQQPQLVTAAVPAPSPEASVAVENIKTTDPRVKRLCQEFKTDEKTMQLLQEAMMHREDFDEDIQALHLVMERDLKNGKKASEALRTHVRSLKANKFAGKDLLDPDIWGFASKYNLDDRVLNKLISTLRARPKTKYDDLADLDERLANTTQPTGLGLLVRLLEGLEETGRLPSPPRRLGGSGRYNPTGTFLHPVDPESKKGKGRKGRDRSRDRRRSRSRSRSKSKSRSRSRSRSRRK